MVEDDDGLLDDGVPTDAEHIDLGGVLLGVERDLVALLGVLEVLRGEQGELWAKVLHGDKKTRLSTWPKSVSIFLGHQMACMEVSL